MPNVLLQYLSVLPISYLVWHIWSRNERQKSPILTLSTYFKVLPSNNTWVEVDDTLPQHTSTIVQYKFTKRIENESVAFEICCIWLNDPLIKASIDKGIYRGNLRMPISLQVSDRFSIRLQIINQHVREYKADEFQINLTLSSDVAIRMRNINKAFIM